MTPPAGSVAPRLAGRADLPALVRLIDASVRGLSAAHYTAAQIESGLRFVFGPDTQLIDDGTYFVVEIDGELAAAGGWSRRQTLFGGDQHKSANDPMLDPRTDAARIRAFFVHPGYARQGLARTLYESCRSAAAREGFRAFELGATLPGVPLYESLGFSAVERVDVTMPDGEVLPIVRMRAGIRGD